MTALVEQTRLIFEFAFLPYDDASLEIANQVTQIPEIVKSVVGAILAEFNTQGKVGYVRVRQENPVPSETKAEGEAGPAPGGKPIYL